MMKTGQLYDQNAEKQEVLHRNNSVGPHDDNLVANTYLTVARLTLTKDGFTGRLLNRNNRGSLYDHNLAASS